MLHIIQAYRGGFEGRPGYWLKLAGQEDFRMDIEKLKQRIAPEHRAFNAEERHWWIEEVEAPKLVGLVEGLDAFLAQPALPGF